MKNSFFTVCGVVEIKNKILLVRHTYGTAKDRLLVPGGHVEEGELPTTALEREIYEETGVTVKASALLSVQFKLHQWCPVFICEYLSGTPTSDHYENSEVLLLPAEEAIARPDLTNMTGEILKLYKEKQHSALTKQSYLPKNTTEADYALFG
ncbi:MAG: NUDIX hydrolase [Ruminococcaceae bacterium]|nr:NUDIX hydrolase [Oscillospiraceae bacterium]